MTNEKLGNLDPHHLIDSDEILRSADHDITYKVYHGWMITQGLIGSILVMFVEDLHDIGLALFASALIVHAIKMFWTSRAGLYQAAKEGAISSKPARRRVIMTSALQGVFFGLLMGLAGWLFLFPEDPVGMQVVFGVICAVFFGLSMWFMNGRVKKRDD